MQIYNRNISVDGVNIFYREAGNADNPTLLLLHGFPSSSVMFKNLMTAMSPRYHLIAPDYPGFGFSDFPPSDRFIYTFDNIARVIDNFTRLLGLEDLTLYLHDYGCPIGLRLCIANPEKVERLIIQNGNAYREGIGTEWDETIDYWNNPTEEKKKKVSGFLSEEGTKMQYTAGLAPGLLNRLSPELWELDWSRMQRPGNIEMQFQLNTDFQSNMAMYQAYQEYFRKYQPTTLVIWGKSDPFFNVREAEQYKRDLVHLRVHVIEGSHMLLETNFDIVHELVTDFLGGN